MAPSSNRVVVCKQQVCERFAVSARTLENMVRKGTFPPPVRLGKQVYWSQAALAAWEQRMFAVQEAWRPGMSKSNPRHVSASRHDQN